MFSARGFFKRFWEAFSNSGTILLNRLEAFTGFMLAVLSSFDWTYLMNMDFSKGVEFNQFGVIGIIMFVKGVVGELTRRRGATDLKV